MINTIHNKSKTFIGDMQIISHYDKEYINCLGTWVHCSFLDTKPVQQKLQPSSLLDFYNSQLDFNSTVINNLQMYPFQTRLQ